MIPRKNRRVFKVQDLPLKNKRRCAPFKWIWKTGAPPRMTFFMWGNCQRIHFDYRYAEKRGNTMVNRGYLCKSVEETCNHLLLWCPTTYSIWNSILGLLGLSWVMAENVYTELWAWTGYRKKKKDLFLIPLTIFCVVWKEKNVRSFEGIETNITNIKNRWIYIFASILLGHDIKDWNDFG